MKNFVTHGEAAAATLIDFGFHFQLSKKDLYLTKSKQIISARGQKFRVADSIWVQLGATGYSPQQSTGQTKTSKLKKKYKQINH